MEIISKICVNSKWIADFLASEDQEHCECFGSCKLRVKSNTGYTYILNKEEIQALGDSEYEEIIGTREVYGRPYS